MRLVVGCALLWAVAALPALGVSISRIAAGERALTVHLAGAGQGRLVLLELRPYQQYRPGQAFPVGWQGSGEGRAIEIPRFDGARDRLYSKFQLAIASSGRPLGAAQYVTDLSALPRPSFELPRPSSIKGLQVQMVEDAIALGVKHAGVNIMVPALFDWGNPAPGETWEADGERFPINGEYVRQLDAIFTPLTRAGMSVVGILNNGVPTRPDARNPLIHPRTDLARSPNHLGGFNTRDERGVRALRAAMEYLAHRYSELGGEHGWVTGYVVGNEVQAHWEWYNVGRMRLAEFVEDYGIALRVTDLAVRRFHPGIRTYISLEHHWNSTMREDPELGFGGKEFVDALAAWSREGGDFPWQMAFHPYPENLFNPRTWEDREAVASFDSPKVTFRNIEVLPAYLRQARLRYQGRPRQLILSEQGFHTPDGPQGEQVQAAAYAYAYYKLSHTPGISAFILHRHVDHKAEGGLRLGLWTWREEGGLADPDRRKPSWEVFRQADTPGWEQASEFAKPIIGIRSWEEVLPSGEIEATPDLTPALTIAEGGRSGYRIVIPDRADPPTRYGARELQHFLAQMCGVKLPIAREGAVPAGPAFLVGPSRRAQAALGADRSLSRLREDGVLVKTVGRDVVLLGQNPRGQLYSVYVLLERYLGVRFLARDCTVVPRRRTLTLPRIAYAYSPPFMYRETLYWDSFPREVAARQRLNGPYSQCDESTGGKIAIFPYVHSFARLVPPAKYYGEHPEYFSLVGGQRTNQTVHGQLCLSNPEVLRIATEGVLEWIKEHPEVPIFDVSQNDGGGACECERCAALVREEGSQHGPILRLVNAIAQVVGERYPGKWIETLAYAYSTTPPAVTRPRENVIIRLCHGGCFFHGFAQCGLGANLAGNLEQWSRLTRRIFVWHYATNFAHYLAPNPNLEGLARDIRYYGAHGVNGLMVQANYQGPGGELAELRQYLAAQLMWDPGRDPGAIRLEFCRGYYGRAAGQVLEYLARLDAEARDPGRHAFAAWDPADTTSPELVAKGLEILTRARARAESPQVAQRVGRLLVPLWYMQLSYPERYGLAREDAPGVLADLAAVARASGITHVCEGAPNMAEWLARMEARYGPAPQGLVYDLVEHMGEAARSHCADWRPEVMTRGGRAAATIFHHPPAQGPGDATFTISLPEPAPGERLLLRFGTGFTGPTTDGVRFAVLVEGKEYWSHQQRELAPVDHELDLSGWAGRRVRLTLRVEAGPTDSYDWANWVRPQVLVVKAGP